MRRLRTPLLALVLALCLAPTARGQIQLASRGPRFLSARTVAGERADASGAAVLRRRVAVTLTGVTVEAALKEIARQADLELIFTRTVLPAQRTVTLHATDITVAGALTVALLDTELDVLLLPGGQMGIVPRVEPAGTEPVQLGTVAGRVTDAKTGVALVGAEVVVEGARRSSTTGSDGRYRVAEVPPGTYTLRARYIGYTPGSASATVTADQEATADFALEKSAQRLDEVVTTGTVVPTEVKALPTPISVITADDIERQKAQRVDQLIRGQVPGVIAFDQGASDYYSTVRTRGASSFTSSGMKIYIDGVEMAGATYDLALLDPNAIDRVEITRGPQASTLYGAEALEGVIQIFTKRGQAGRTRPELAARASVGAIGGVPDQNTAVRSDNAVSVRGGSGSATYSVTGSLRRAGEWIADYGSTDWALSAGTTVRQGAFTLDAFAQYTVKRFDQARSVRVPYPTFQIPTNITWDRRQQVFGATISYRATPGWSHSLTLGYSGSPGSYSKTQPTLLTPNDTLLAVYSYSLSVPSVLYHTDLRLPVSRAVSATATAGVNYTTSTYLVDLTLGTPVTQGALKGTYNSHTRLLTKDVGYFAQAQLSLAERLFLTGGVRAEQNDYFGQGIGLAWSPRVGAAYVLSVAGAQVKVRGSYGEALRAPQFGAREPSIASYGIQLANPDLRPERQRGWDAGLEFYVGRQVSLGITYYRQRAVDLIQRVTLLQSTTQPTIQNQNVGTIRNEGVELEGRVALGPVDLAGTYTIMHSTVGALSPTYTGALQVGDRLLGVPRSIGGATLTYATHWGTTLTANVAYIGHLTNPDNLALYAYYFGSQPYRGSERAYWIDYPTITKVMVGLSQRITKDVTGFVHAENIGNNLRPEGGDNLTYPTPRSILVGATLRY